MTQDKPHIYRRNGQWVVDGGTWWQIGWLVKAWAYRDNNSEDEKYDFGHWCDPRKVGLFHYCPICENNKRIYEKIRKPNK